MEVARGRQFYEQMCVSLERRMERGESRMPSSGWSSTMVCEAHERSGRPRQRIESPLGVLSLRSPLDS